jgi:autotransporter-associated beta strand protein
MKSSANHSVLRVGRLGLPVSAVLLVVGLMLLSLPMMQRAQAAGSAAAADQTLRAQIGDRVARIGFGGWNFTFGNGNVSLSVSGFAAGEPPQIAGDTPPALGNYPGTSIQLSGNTTVMADAGPTNTTSITVSTSAGFKGTFAANPMTGVVRVTNSHPAGTYTVTVKAFGKGGTAIKKFALTVTTAAICKPGSFASAANVSVGSSPTKVAAGDFNNDGKQDLAIVSFSDSVVGIRLGDGSGAFAGTPDAGASDARVGTNPVSGAVGDFNGDGNQDFAVANFDANAVSIRLGNGAGGLSGTTEVGVSSGPDSVAIGDFNGDGKLDLAVANYYDNTVSIRLGDGIGGFSGATEVGVGAGPRSVVIGDFDGNGKLDFATANSNSNTVSIRLGDGMGGFGGTTEVGVGSNPLWVAIGYFNGDANQDLAVANHKSNSVSIRLGDGAGGFTGTTEVSVGSNPCYVAVADFTGDDKQDLAVANFGSNTVSIRFGDGNGGFGGTADVGVGANPSSLVIGDFNGDGRQDFAAVNNGSGTVSIRLRQCIAPEINVKDNGVSIADGDTTPTTADHTDFGRTSVPGGTVVHAFTIENTGTAALTVNGITLSGMYAGDFTVSGNSFPAIIGSGDATTFMVTFNPSARGVRTATVSIDNDDSDENPYTFAIQGTGPAATTDAGLSAGNLVITDVDGGNTDDALMLSLNGGNVSIHDPNNTLGAGNGATLVDANTVEVSLASITGNIQVNTLAGTDTLTLSLAGGDFIPAGGLSFAGGDPTSGPGDKLIITGGSQGTVTYNYINAHDGSVVMSNFGTVSYTGLEPVSNSGNATDIIFNLPAGPNAATLGDDGTSGNTMSRLSGATIETTDFANPTGSLTINRGNAADTLTVNALPDFNASLTIGLAAMSFGTVDLSGAATLLGDKNLSVSATNVNATATGAITVSGAGAINLAADNAVINAAASLTATGTVSIVTVTAGRKIDLGGNTAGQLALTDAELDRVTANTLKIGDSNSGMIVINDEIDLTDGPIVPNLLVTTGASIFDSHDGIEFRVSNLTMTAPSAVGSGTPGAIDIATDSVTASTNNNLIHLFEANREGVAGTTNIGAAGLRAGTGPVTLAGGTFVATDASSFDDTSDLIFGTGVAVFNMNGFNQTIDALSSVDTNDMITSGVAGAVTLTVGNRNGSGNFRGTLENGSGTFSLTKVGTATQTLSGNNTYSGATTINTGTLTLSNASNNNIASSATITVGGGGFLNLAGLAGSQFNLASGQTLQGTGTVSGGAINALSGSSIAPGTSPGILNTGSVTFNSGSTFSVEIGGTTPGNTATSHDQLNVTGSVSPNGATLSLASFGGFTPALGQSFVIINNDSTDAITTTFAGLSEGATISNFLGSGLNATITYQGGSNNNDVVLTVVNGNSPPTIMAVAVSREKGATSSSQIATVNDSDQAEETLSVTISSDGITFGASATENGVTISSLSVDAMGKVTANVAASCAATNADFIVKVTDNVGAAATTTSPQLIVTVTPETAPPTVTCPSNIMQDAAAGQCSTSVAFTATASDNCPGATASCMPASGSTFQVGTTTVTCKATDAAGNVSANCTFTVTVNDTQAPTITCPMSVVRSTDPNQCQAAVNYPNATATDNCFDVGTPVCTPASGSMFPRGMTTVTCTVSDASGNPANCSFTVTVNDTQPPMFPNGCSAGIIMAAHATCPFTTSLLLNYTKPIATDNCEPAPAVVCNPPSGSVFPLRTTVVTCTATDSSGKTATCTFPVNVYSFCLQDDSNDGNVVFVNAVTGEYLFCQNGVTIASRTGTLVVHGCNFQVDDTKGDRKVHIQGDTSANSGAGSGTAYIQKAGGGFVAQITDRRMSDDTCTCSPPQPPASSK